VLLPKRERARAALIRLLAELASTGVSVMDLARGGRTQEPWTLYPGEEGIFDRMTRSQFYYHAHAGANHEAGHFHTVRLFSDHTAHVAAISMADDGWPQALFTVNLWAIGDVHCPPETLKVCASLFRLHESRGDARLVRFINLTFQAFLPEIEQLQDDKERVFRDYRDANGGRDPYEDRSIEIVSEIPIDLRARLSRASRSERSPG
jgi:hypothetical protein